MTDQAINYRKKCAMAQNIRRWNRGQNQDKTKKRWLVHWKSYQSKRSIHMFVWIVNTDITQYMNHSHQIVKYIQLKLDVQKSLWSLWLAVISLYTYVRSTIHYPPIRFKIHTYYNFSHVILLKENKGYFCKTKWWSMVIHTNRLCSFSSFFVLFTSPYSEFSNRQRYLFILNRSPDE